MKTFTLTTLVLAAACTLAACSPGAPASDPATNPPASATAPAPAPPSATPSEEVPMGFAITSPDFANGEELADSATASAFEGQCAGENLNPALAWSEAPAGTVTFAIRMLDESASGWVHWVHANIPADVTQVAQGASAALPGVQGRDQATGEPGYFGPCPPGPDHRYVFTVYALDTELALETGFSSLDLTIAMQDHVLGSAEITGMRSGSA